MLPMMQATEDSRLLVGELLSDTPGPSLRSRLVNALLGLMPYKKRLSSAAVVQEHVRRLAAQPAPYAPTGIGRGVEVTAQDFRGWPVYYMSPTERAWNGRFVVFLHGGGFINEIVRVHWRLVAFLAREAGVRCVVPIFPLAPKATASIIVPGTGDLLKALVAEVGAQNLTVIGNSAGAGLALAASQWLRDEGHEQPRQLVLISPWLDASISRPEQHAIARTDPIQDIPGFMEAGRLYAGDLDVSHPYVSPLNGNLRGLPPMLVFAGTRDLLYPDSVGLALNARTAGIAVELQLWRGQPHSFPVFPTPEGKAARASILRALEQN